MTIGTLILYCLFVLWTIGAASIAFSLRDVLRSWAYWLLVSHVLLCGSVCMTLIEKGKELCSIF
jgi:hypothetical protein